MLIDTRKFEKCISSERFSVCIKKVNGNRTEALKLYKWNTAISGSFYCILQDLEVVLRVAINESLTNQYGMHWYNSKHINFNKYALSKIKNAKEKIRDNNIKTVGKIKNIDLWQVPNNIVHNMVPCLTFGFWVLLFAKRYEETLWNPVLSSIFPKGKSREETRILITHLRDFRNDIAHHQFIFDRDLEMDYQKILDVLGWLSPEIRDLVISTTRIPFLLEGRHKTDLFSCGI